MSLKPKTKTKSKGEERNHSMFGPPKHKKLADIVSIETPTKARKSVEKLLTLHVSASRSERVNIRRAMVLAMNRALAQTKRKNLSPKERSEMMMVAAIYDKGVQKALEAERMRNWNISKTRKTRRK